jgi:hypothetical protein
MKISSPKAINWTLKQYGYYTLFNPYMKHHAERLVDPKVSAKNFGY